jgi:hypothetical protein
MKRTLGWWMIVIAGCGPAVSTGDTGGDDGTADADAGSDELSGPDATATMTMTEPDSVTDPTPGTTVGTTATTVEPVGCDTEFVSACQAYCATVITCDPESGIYEECVTGCGEELATETPACALARCELYACFGTLSCDQLDTGAPDCEALAGEVAGLCDGGDGECSIGFGPDGTCEYSCSGTPDRRMSCSGGDICLCYEDEIEIAKCPSFGICTSPDSFEANVKACCGW